MLSANAAVARATLPEAPFRGIESFRYVDQPIFFARGEETQKLLRYVSIYRGVLFYGESGCGKSSLINAGFIPAIITEGFTPDRLRVQPKPGEEIVVERISTKDTGEAPYLPSNFIASEETSSRVVLSAEKLRERLQQLLISSPARRPILIFDQFEEFATLFEEAPRGEDIQRARLAQQAVLKLIVDLQRDASLPVKLLFSFREDYLAKLSKLIALWPDLSDQSQRLTAPSMDSLPRIIRGSFEKYPGSFGKELSPKLTSDVSIALEARNEGGRLNLSEVQIACLQLWQSNDPDALFESKDVQGLLEDYLSDSLNRLATNLRDPAVALLSRMVTPSGTRNIVSEYDLISQAQEDEGIPEDLLREALRALVEQTKLVRRERRYDTYFYDIVSEFLVPWISRQKVERLAALEVQKLEAIERRKRKKAFLVAGASLLLAIGIGVAGFFVIRQRNKTIAYQQQVGYLQILRDQEVQRARTAENQANRQMNLAEKQLNLAEKQSAELQTQLQNLQKTVADLTQQNNQRFQEGYDQANSKAIVQAMAVYKTLLGTSKKADDLCNRIGAAAESNRSAQDVSTRETLLCSQIKNEIGDARSVLRVLGSSSH